MQKTILSPTDHTQLEQWVKLLKEAEASYRLIPVGKTTRLEVEPDIAESVLGIEPPKRMAIWKIALIVLAALTGFAFLGYLVSETEGTAIADADTEFTLNFKDILYKSKKDLITKFGEPLKVTPLKECPEGNCEILDFPHGLSVFTKAGAAYRFEYFDSTEVDDDEPLMELGIEGYHPADVRNEIVTRWKNLGGKDITVMKTEDRYLFSVRLLTEKEIAELKRYNQIQALFDDDLGQVPNVMHTIMNIMNDPSSYEHVESSYTDEGDPDFVYVNCTFRGKNGFGALVLNKALAKVDFSGNVLDLKLID